jgi:hypothetical protein
VRISPGEGVQLVVAGALAALLGWLAVQTPLEGARPRAHESVLLVCALALLFIALVRLAKVLGADFDKPLGGATAWTALLEAAAAAALAARRRSAIAALVAAVAFAVATIAGYNELFDPGSVTPFRWLLLALALLFGLVSLPLRGVSLRHADQLVNAAGLAILAIPLVQGFGLFTLLHVPGFWEFVLLAAGCSLVAYSTADRAPGPAYLGVANLLAFVVVVGGSRKETLEWWPVTLLVLGAIVLTIGLRPRSPLPPEPESYRADELPLSARSESDVSVRVRRVE